MKSTYTAGDFVMCKWTVNEKGDPDKKQDIDFMGEVTSCRSGKVHARWLAQGEFPELKSGVDPSEVTKATPKDITKYQKLEAQYKAKIKKINVSSESDERSQFDGSSESNESESY